MARKRKQVPRIIQFSSHKIWIYFIVFSTIYFWCVFFASQAPFLRFFTNIWSFFVGPWWSHIMAWLVWAYWVALFLRHSTLWTIVKQLVVIAILLSALFNFSIVWQTNIAYETAWGRLSWPIIAYFFPLLWNSFIANIVIVWWLMARLVRVRRTLWIDVPTINISESVAKLKQNIPEKSKPQPEKVISQPSTNNSFKTSLKQAVLQKLWQNKIEPEKSTYQPIVYPTSKPVFPISLLEKPVYAIAWDDIKIAAQAEMIKSKLAEFGIPVHLDGRNIWPSIVQIKIRPDTWVKIALIENHKPDIMAALKTKSLRIIAPIPGTDVIGLEIPNPAPVTVRLSEILWSAQFAQTMKSWLMNLSIGKTVDGTLLIKSLDSMPHLLVAWATWQWKSVWINDFIVSLLYQNSPDEVKFIMVDPKQVEMELYSWLPYQLCPIITDPEIALKALKRCAVEMDDRYTLLKNNRVRNLAEYTEKTWERLPRIVIIIDELADLMMTGKKKDVEIVIARIAQKARAIGMHLILATQRPSVNVITGLIKANIPTRISFGVVSQIDSRTILDMKWAEDLVGKWDLLYMDPGTKFPTRVQAPFIETQEIEKIVQSIKNKYLNGIEENHIYHPWLMRLLESKWAIIWYVWGEEWDDEDLCNQAIDLIRDSRRASTTFLQKKLSIGFARASRIMDILEERWVVWPQDGAKAREVLV